MNHPMSSVLILRYKIFSSQNVKSYIENITLMLSLNAYPIYQGKKEKKNNHILISCSNFVNF